MYRIYSERGALFLADADCGGISAPPGQRVRSVCFLSREGALPPVHPFLGLLLRLYGIQLHHLTPDCITHTSCFITLCEGYFCVHPHLGWWCSLFSLVGRIEGEGDAESECGAVRVVPCRSDYLDLKLLGVCAGWERTFFYFPELPVA